MAFPPNSSKLAAYRSTSVHSGVAAADPAWLDRGQEPAERPVDVPDELDLGPSHLN